MKTCPNCGTQNPDEAKFCSKCGNQFLEISPQKNDNVSVSPFPKYINVAMGVLIAIYAFMSISFMIMTIESHGDYKHAMKNALEDHPVEYYKHMDVWGWVTTTEAYFDVALCWTIGAFISLLCIGLLWHWKSKVLFYVYVIVTFIVTCIGVIMALDSGEYSLAAGSLYPFGVLLTVVIFSLVKIKGETFYNILK